MINHFTLDCHVTFSTRSIAGPELLFEPLTSNWIPTLTQSLTKAYNETLTLTRNYTNFLIRSYHVIDTVFRQYLAREAF